MLTNNNQVHQDSLIGFFTETIEYAQLKSTILNTIKNKKRLETTIISIKCYHIEAAILFDNKKNCG